MGWEVRDDRPLEMLAVQMSYGPLKPRRPGNSRFSRAVRRAKHYAKRAFRFAAWYLYYRWRVKRGYRRMQEIAGIGKPNLYETMMRAQKVGYICDYIPGDPSKQGPTDGADS